MMQRAKRRRHQRLLLLVDQSSTSQVLQERLFELNESNTCDDVSTGLGQRGQLAHPLQDKVSRGPERSIDVAVPITSGEWQPCRTTGVVM